MNVLVGPVASGSVNNAEDLGALRECGTLIKLELWMMWIRKCALSLYRLVSGRSVCSLSAALFDRVCLWISLDFSFQSDASGWSSDQSSDHTNSFPKN